MLDKLPKSMWKEEKTFCDPTCGNGNMLVEILKRKLAKGHDPVRALNTLYGVDIMRNNIDECRMRLGVLVGEYLKDADDKTILQISKILKRNIIKHDALTYNWEFK